MHRLLRLSLLIVSLLFAVSSTAVIYANEAVIELGQSQLSVRKPHVAGQFYPDDPTLLRETIQGLLKSNSPEHSSKKPRILIAPHAGYQYSGGIAATAFGLLQGYEYDGVVVVGFSHKQPFAGASIDDRDLYETPLGDIKVDHEASEFLRSHHQRLSFYEEAHLDPEHSLEVMLPFLQVTLGDFKLIPILLGNSTLTDAIILADALSDLAREGDYLFVFSTDLSHYHPYDEAKTIDERTVNALIHETPEAVHRLFDANYLEGCGRGPITASLKLASNLGYLSKKLIAYANSGDTAGDHSRVVGYTSIAMYDRDVLPNKFISDEAGMALVRAARKTLEYGLAHEGKPPADLALDQYPELASASGIFVTLHQKGLLCGCIGRIETRDALSKSLPFVALDAALRDPRFAPVKADELDQIHIEVSVLTPRTRLENIEALVPGRDGVVLEYGGRSGVFLPTVWESSGFTRIEFLRELSSQKAHLPPDAWKQADLYVFQSEVFEE